jgi:RimJ/RimL family protein N-acetyltransferase
MELDITYLDNTLDKQSIDDYLKFINEVRNEYAAKFLHDGRVFSVEQTKNWFYSIVCYYKKPEGYWIINDTNQSNNFTKIGYVRVSNYSIQNQRLMIGIDISPAFSGKGYATKSFYKIIPYLFKTYNLNKISLEVLSDNDRAIHLYNKIGFKKEGVKRQDIVKNGIWLDSIIMSIIKSEYEN